MPQKINIVGIGPGCSEYLTPAAHRAVEESSLLIGGVRALSLFSQPEKKKIPIKLPLEGMVKEINKLSDDKKVAVLVSGDPGLYSMLNFLKKHFDLDLIEVIPGISSFQIAFARLKLSFEGFRLLSFHGRDPEKSYLKVVKALREGDGVAFLCDSTMTPAAIASYLLNKGLEDRDVYVLSHLTYPQESVEKTSLKSLSFRLEISGNSVMVINNE